MRYEQALHDTVGFIATRSPGATLVTSSPISATVPFDVLDLIDNKLDVLGSFRYKNTYPAAIDLLADAVVDVEDIVEFESSLEDIDDAFHRAIDPNVAKGMITLES